LSTHRIYDNAAVRAAAEDLGQGWQRATIELAEGDIAPSYCSTKWDLRGGKNGATVVYEIHPSGINVIVTEGSVGRAYREGAIV